MILIAGPCVGEQSEQWIVDQAYAIAEQLEPLVAPTQWVFKCSFDKANRTSLGSYRGLGLESTLRALYRIKEDLGCMVTTDIHEPSQAPAVADVVDVIQIPAMLSRQTDLIKAASANVVNAINIKCSTSASAEEMEYARGKAASRAWLTYRGTAIANRIFFLPEQLVAIQDLGVKTVLMDVTHVARDVERGAAPWNPMSLIAAQCALALDVDGFFLECHPDPVNALSDRSTQIKIVNLADFLMEAGWPR